MVEALHVWRTGGGVTRSFPVGVVQQVEEFRSELEREALGDAEVLQQTRIQIPEIRPLDDVAAIAVLSWRRDAKRCLRPDDVDAVKVWVSGELAGVVHHRPFHAIDELYVALVERAFHLCEADVRSIGRERTAGDAIRLATLVSKDAGIGPTPDDLVRPPRCSRSKPLTLPDREFVQQVRQQHVCIIEVRKCAIQAPVANICWRPAVRRAQASARSRAAPIDRHVVNRLAKRVRKAQIQALFEAASHGDKQTVVIRVTARILKEDLPELRIGPEKIPGERAVRSEVRTPERARAGKTVQKVPKLPYAACV